MDAGNSFGRFRLNRWTMNLESCFDFLSESDIRIRGTRVGIETVLCDFLDGASPEEIAVRYASLQLSDVYATITYYLHNRTRVDCYLEECRLADEAAGKEQAEHPKNLVSRLRGLKESVILAGKG